MPDFPIEGAPCDEQKMRLEDWLTQLTIICRAYGILLDTEDGETRIVDLHTQRIIGMGLTYHQVLRADREYISHYLATDSILDGVWPVDTPDGVTDQRNLGSPWPRRPADERPQ